MTRTVTIIDYGMGNLSSVANALAHLGTDSLISSNPKDLRGAKALILPGVGAFGQAMQNLKNMNLVDEMSRQVLENKKPFLGICLGMQLIAEDSEELGFNKGLGWIEGHVRKIPVTDGLRLPHIGWNNIHVTQTCPLFDGIKKDMNFYFVHSFQVECEGNWNVAHTDYGVSVTAAIRKENIFATQFHPEKSHENGLTLLKNFMEYTQRCSSTA